MSRPQRYGRDSNFVTSGTVNAVKRIVCTDQWHVKCTRYLPKLQAGLSFMYMTRFTQEKTPSSAVFICQNIKKNFLKMDILYRTYYTSMGLKM